MQHIGKPSVAEGSFNQFYLKTNKYDCSEPALVKSI